MKATEILMAEHRNIVKILDGLEGALSKAEGGAFDGRRFEIALAFLREYADRRHHGKEEERLFPAMNRRGMPFEGGPLHCMLEEHKYGRGLLASVAAALPGAQAGDQAARRTVTEDFGRYIAFLREHIHKEDNVLFMMADGILTPEDQKALEAEFGAFDGRKIGEKELVIALSEVAGNLVS